MFEKKRKNVCRKSGNAWVNVSGMFPPISSFRGLVNGFLILQSISQSLIYFFDERSPCAHILLGRRSVRLSGRFVNNVKVFTN